MGGNREHGPPFLFHIPASEWVAVTTYLSRRLHLINEGPEARRSDVPLSETKADIENSVCRDV